MLKSVMITGSAGDMTVWFSRARKAPRTTTATIRIWVPVMRPSVGAETVVLDIGSFRSYGGYLPRTNRAATG